MRDSTRYWLVVAILTLVHIGAAVLLPISGDEAYYWDCSRHPAWSYFDQPPLVIWSMIPLRATLGENALAVRGPAVGASVLLAVLLLPLVRRLGGRVRDATWAYLALHAMPVYALGAFYTSTDVVMTTAWVGATLAAVALVQGNRRGWWWFGLACGLGFLAKFPITLVLPVVIPVLATRHGRADLARPTPWLAGAGALALTAPVWIWGTRHDWVNIGFQLAGRHTDPPDLTLTYLIEFIGANLLLASPPVAVALMAAWFRRVRNADRAWMVLLISAAAPLLVFGLLALRGRVGAHWGAPGLVVAMVVLALDRGRWRRWWIVAGAVLTALIVTAVVTLVSIPEKIADVEWSYHGRPHRISTRKLEAVIGNREVLSAIQQRIRPGEVMASESYTTVHLMAFLSGGTLPTRLAHVKPGKHGLASLYWYTPEELEGIDVLFITKKQQVDGPLREIFHEVSEEAPIRIVRDGRVVRELRVLRCLDLHTPHPAFTRLE